MTGIRSPTDRRVYAGPALPVRPAPRERSGPRAYQLPFLRLVQRSGWQWLALAGDRHPAAGSRGGATISASPLHLPSLRPAPRRRIASTRSASAGAMRAGPEWTPNTWFERNPARSCRPARRGLIALMSLGLLLSGARHRPHPYLLLRRIRRSIIREILANARVVGSKSIDNWRVGRQRQHHIQRIVAQRAWRLERVSTGCKFTVAITSTRRRNKSAASGPISIRPQHSCFRQKQCCAYLSPQGT
jgi:hypothetical protein